MTTLEELERRVKILEQKRIYQGDVSPLAIKQRHIDGIIIFRGDAADRPTNGSTIVQAYFAEDTKVFSIWNRTSGAWESETLS